MLGLDRYKFRVIAVNFFILFLSSMLFGCGNGSNSSVTANPSPVISESDINMFFIQSLEPNSATGSLSIKGLNHSLLLGQMLTQIIGNGKVTNIYAEMPETQLINGYPNMMALQSIENYAVLNTKNIVVTLSYTNIESNVQFINTLLQSATPGNYVFAMPYNLINTTLESVSIDNGFTFNQLQANQYSNYILVTKIPSNKTTATTYNDGINASSTYPKLNVPTNGACKDKHFVYTTPESAIPPGINKNQTLYFIKHVEKEPQTLHFENGNYICQGQWRALALPSVLPSKIGGLPDFVYSSDPAELMESFSYVRPSLSISPFVIDYSMPLSLVSGSQFQWNQPESMANFFFTGGQFTNRDVLVVWEHKSINLAVDYLIESIYNQPLPKDFPKLTTDNYDTIWKLEFNSVGQLTFSNSCEGILTESLPDTCPTF